VIDDFWPFAALGFLALAVVALLGYATYRRTRFKPEPASCEHGYTGDWSDDCPDCRH
jgi:hypothetical protein